MKVSMHQRNLQELQERFRVIHEQNLKQLEKANCQTNEMKLPLVPPSPQTTAVDILV